VEHAWELAENADQPFFDNEVEGVTV